MKTKTIKMFGNTVAVYGYRPRLVQKRYGIKRGETFTGFHFGKSSHYVSLPAFSSRKFGGVNDIVKV